MAPKRNLDKELSIRKLRNVSGTLVVTIPPELTKQLKWASGDLVAIKKEGNQLRISKVRMEVIE